MSIRLTPASRAARQIAAEAASSASPPNDIAPRAMRDTRTPVAPSRRVSIIAPRSSRGDFLGPGSRGAPSPRSIDRPRSSMERRLDPVQHLLLARRHLAEAQDPARRGRDHLGEADDLVAEQPVLLVVELRRERLDVGLPRGEQLVA